MKKFFILFLFCCTFLCSCSSGLPEPTDSLLPQTDRTGNIIEYSKSGKHVSIDNFPCELEYNGATFELTGVDMYESYSEETYSYFLYSVVRFNVSNLSDSDIHWLRKEDLSIGMLYDSEISEDKFDFVHMSELGSLHVKETDELFYVFTPSYWNAYRDSFSGYPCSLMVDVTQQETYEYDKDTDLNKEFSCFYSFDIPANMENSEEIEQPLYDYMVKWLEQDIEFYSKF